MKQSPKCCGYSGRFFCIISWGIVLLCIFLASYLTGTSRFNNLLKRPLNPLALRSSPYGMLLSSLLQQPVNVEWHKGIEISEAKPEKKEEHDHEAEHDHDKAAGKSSHHHAEGEKCETCDIAAGRFSNRGDGSMLSALSEKLGSLARIHATRTNPNTISPAHKLHIAQNIERKLLLSYNLDPTNFAAYDAYFLFLTENIVPGMANPEKIKQAQLISQRTFELSNREQVNPLQALSAGLAIFNNFMIHFLLEKPKDKEFNRLIYTKVTEQLAKYARLKAIAVSTGDWELAPEAWRLQADQRAQFLQRVAQDLAEKSGDNESK